MESLESKLIHLVIKIKADKESGCYNGNITPIYPSFALLNNDIIPAFKDASVMEVKKALWSLYKQGKLKWGHTINDLYFEHVG